MSPAAEHPVRSPWTTFLLVAGSMVVGTLNYSLVFVAFPDLQKAFDASSSAVSWSMTAFSITVAALTMPAGWMADRIGRTRQFLAGSTLFAIGSLLVALSPNLALLVTARVVQAAGLAAEGPAAVAIVLAAFPADRRSTAVGAIGAVGGVFAATGPVLGGLLIDSLGWRWTFASTIPVSVVSIVLGRRYLARDTPTASGARTSPDALGAALLIAGVSLLALGIVEGPHWGWASPAVIGSLAGAVMLLGALLRRSRSHPDPIIDLSLWRSRRFRIGTVLGFVIAGHFGSIYLTALIMLTEVWGLSRTGGGMALGLIPTVGGPLTLIAGRWADRHGHATVILPGCVLFVAAGVFLVAGVSADRQLLAVWLPAVVLYGTAVGLSHAACQSAALADIAPERLGRASSTSRIASDLGSTIWVAVAIAVVASAPDTITGVRWVFSTMIVVGVVGGVVALGLRRDDGIPAEHGVPAIGGQ